MICILVGVVSVSPQAVSYGCALIFGVVLSRAFTTVSVSRARSAGFEMLWLGSQASAQASRNRPLKISAELRNRDTLATHFKDLTVTCSPGLLIEVHPSEGTIAPGGRLEIELSVTPLRVGYHGIHTLTLSTIRAPGLFTVPLAFSNPFVVEVFPQSVRLGPLPAAGGRTLRLSTLASVGKRRGEALELRELREHQSGDPYRRIAWKASARRGKLMVIDREEETQDRVWLVLEASVDSASGEVGKSALDRGCDLAMQLIHAHMQRGDEVGLAIIGRRRLKVVPPNQGAGQNAELLFALSHYCHTADMDRCQWDEADTARKVHEHARSLDRDVAVLSARDYELLVHSARRLMHRAPVKAREAWSSNPGDETLRNYLLSFGIQPPPRGASDRYQTELEMARFITEVTNQRGTCSQLTLIGRPPNIETPKQLLSALQRASRRRIQTRFFPVVDFLPPETAHPTTQENRLPSVERLQSRIVSDALLARQRLATEDGIGQLRQLGVHVPRRRSSAL